MTRAITRAFTAVAMAMVALAFAASGAAAQGANYGTPASATCPTSTITPGGTLECSATGFAPGAQVLARIVGAGCPALESTVVADANGRATVRFDIPSNAGDALCQVSFTGLDPTRTFERTVVANFTVDAPAPGVPGAPGAPAGPAAPGLPTTGSEVTRGVALAAAVIIAGATMVVVGRRRRRADEDVTVGR